MRDQVPGVSSIMSCRRVKDSASPSASAASVADDSQPHRRVDQRIEGVGAHA